MREKGRIKTGAAPRGKGLSVVVVVVGVVVAVIVVVVVGCWEIDGGEGAVEVFVVVFRMAAGTNYE